jgi:hypothetical protein
MNVWSSGNLTPPNIGVALEAARLSALSSKRRGTAYGPRRPLVLELESAVRPLNGDVYVSTVSIVGNLRENLTDLIAMGADQIGRNYRRESPADGGKRRPMAGSIPADAADGADGIFEAPAYPNDPAAGMAFTAERNVDAQHPKERLRAPQPAPSARGFLGPPDTAA